jgi:hypothetical protein
VVTFGAGGKTLEKMSYEDGVFSGSFLKKATVIMKLQKIVPDD